jgi:hypothetical protein
MVTDSKIFQALLKEAEFTKEMLGAGATQIRRANYASKGMYFQAFTSLSTGLERIGKLCLMLDYFLDHRRFPDVAYMKREIGHQISLIHERTEKIIEKRQLNLKYPKQPSSTIHAAIINELSNFAQGDRYSNIDLLVGNSRQSDPIATWFQKVDKPIYESYVSDKRKESISSNAQIISKMLGESSVVLHTSESGDTMTSLFESSARTGVIEAVSPWRQLFMLQIIRYWVEVLMELRDRIHLQHAEVPYFGEVLGIFYNDDSYFKTRKTWVSP